MAHIGRRVANDAGAPMTAAYGADGHSHQRASSAEGSESQGGRSSATVRERLFQGITVTGKGLKGPKKVRLRAICDQCQFEVPSVNFARHPVPCIDPFAHIA